MLITTKTSIGDHKWTLYILSCLSLSTKKGKHLSLEEGGIIQTRIKDGFSLRAIARELDCSPSTVSYEVNLALFCFIMTRKSVRRQNIAISFIILTVKTVASVMTAFQALRKQYSEHWNEIFKTITTDNGSEFADLSNLEKASKTLLLRP
ncbi:hypothetical protein IMAU80668_01852 [Lactobacillus helveticus]|nr:hypothetical protein [Lactobacillus helveticus]NRN94290.1 hypothetical protein [Lactobacillus helveticus]NRO43561.1 hypothetical protein [Lactobacillus helveticus]